jgi:leucyl aminopeptidase
VTIVLESRSLLEAPTDAIAVAMVEGEPISGEAAAVDRALAGGLTQAVAHQEFEARSGQILVLHSLGQLPARVVLVVGLGKARACTADTVRQAYGRLAQKALELKVGRLTAALFRAEDLGARQASQAAAEGLLLGEWRFAGYHQQDEGAANLQVTLVGEGEEARSGLEWGRRVGEACNLTRELGATPANYLYPDLLATRTIQALEGLPVAVEVLDERKLGDLGMGGLLAVGQGSAHPPRLVILRYQGGGDHTLALVGKGITFDSGGISIKGANGMDEMKYDMLGAAAVLGAVRAVAELRLPLNLLGIMCLAENLPGGHATRPGDVVRIFNGKTIEIGNTDAEGRVVLADGVSYADHLGADWIVEASTLTGAVWTVLGHEATALVATDDDLADLVEAAAADAGDRVWRLPVYPEYRELYKSDVADLKNNPGRDAATITAGLIISEFAGERPFVHLDIAGTAWRKQGPLNRQYGPTGIPVRTLVALAARLAG